MTPHDRLIGGLAVLAWLLTLLGVQPASAQPTTGRIEGVVRFTGKVPPPQRIITSDGGVLIHSDLVVDAKSKGLRWTAVYLEEAPAAGGKEGKPVIVDQRDMIFIPRVVTARDGQTVRFDNNDLCNHAVQAVSARSENVFNVLTPMGQPFDYKFTAQKGPVQIGCPIHAWMRAWVYVLPHSFSAVTDAEGRFTISDVPPGTYKLMLTHPDTGLRERREVVVEAGRSTRVAVEWTAVK